MKSWKLTYATLVLLTLAAGAIEAAPAPEGPLDELLSVVAGTVRKVVAAGALDSDKGREVSPEETEEILLGLVEQLEDVARKIPSGDDAGVPVSPWTGRLLLGVAEFIPKKTPVLEVLSEVLSELGYGVSDENLTGDDVIGVIGSIREAIEAALDDAQ